MRLLRAEWTRLFTRRFTAIMIVTALGLLALIGLTVAGNSEKPSPAVAAKAKQLADRERAFIRETRAECERVQQSGEPGAADRFPPGIDCAQAFDEAQVRDEYFLPQSFNFVNEASGYIFVFGGIFALVAFAVGASFIGADWSSGALMNLLTWRPRRIPVLLTKLAALLTGLLAVGVVLAVIWVAVLYGLASWRGAPGDPTTGSMTSLGLDTVRVLVLGLASAVLGFGLASLGRHTATALGVAVGWLVVLEIGLRIALESAEVSRLQQWFASTYVAAWVDNGAVFFDDSACDYSVDTECTPIRWTIGMGEGALVIGIVTALVLLAALVAMRRRDVA